MAANTVVDRRERRTVKAVVNFMPAWKCRRAGTGAEPQRTDKGYIPLWAFSQWQRLGSIHDIAWVQ